MRRIVIRALIAAALAVLALAPAAHAIPKWS